MNAIQAAPPETGAALTSDQVEGLLYEAGYTLMALRVSGCWPAGFRTCMPESAIDPEDLKYAEAEWSAPQPNPRQVSAMDRAYGWVNRLPWQTPVQLRAKKLVLDRMRVSAKTGRVVFNWSRLGERHGISHTWAKTLWIQTVDQITAIANAPLPPACAATFARIRAQSVAQGLGAAAPPPISEVERLRRLAVRPKPAPCQDTLRRIAAVVETTSAGSARELVAA